MNMVIASHAVCTISATIQEGLAAMQTFILEMTSFIILMMLYTVLLTSKD